MALLPVFAVHYMTLFGFLIGRGAESPAWGEVAQQGVDLFFLLSGYLVYGVLLDGRLTVGVFLWRRCRRIYPVFLVLFALYLGLSAVFPERSKIPHGWEDGGWYVLVNLLLLPGVFNIQPLIRVAWSLSYEAVYYTLLAAAAWSTGFVRRAAGVRVAWMVAIAVVYWCACWWHGEWYVKGIVLAPLGHPRLVLFLVGMVVREAHGERWKLPGTSRWWAAWFGLVLWGLWGVPAAGVQGQCVAAVLMAVGAGPIIYWAGLPDNQVARWLSWGVLRQLGKVSYSFYLVHGLVMHGLAMGLSKVWSGTVGVWWCAGLAPVVFSAATVAAAVLYALVERPLSIRRRAEGMSALHGS